MGKKEGGTVYEAINKKRTSMNAPWVHPQELAVHLHRIRPPKMDMQTTTYRICTGKT